MYVKYEMTPKVDVRPMYEKPASTVDAVKKPASTTDAVKKSASTTDAVKKPASTTDAVKKPASTTDAVKKPASTTDAVKKPASTTDAVKKPVTTTEAVKKPVTTEEDSDTTTVVEENANVNVEKKSEVSVAIVMEELAKAKDLNIQSSKLIHTVMSMMKKLTKSMQPRKKRERNPDMLPSGFARPGPVTQELSMFLGMANGEPVARTTVTKQMSIYIKENELQNPERKREIVLDEKLAKLFKMKVGNTVEYFAIQKMLKNHYIKAEDA